MKYLENYVVLTLHYFYTPVAFTTKPYINRRKYCVRSFPSVFIITPLQGGELLVLQRLRILNHVNISNRYKSLTFSNSKPLKVIEHNPETFTF